MNANFEYYKVFYYVSKYENLTKAASVLKTSQPAVTRTIHNLENILQTQRQVEGMHMYKISVIIPVYNAEKTLPYTLKSTVAQSLSDIEIICVDDGSTDQSFKIIKNWQTIRTIRNGLTAMEPCLSRAERARRNVRPEILKALRRFWKS